MSTSELLDEARSRFVRKVSYELARLNPDDLTPERAAALAEYDASELLTAMAYVDGSAMAPEVTANGSEIRGFVDANAYLSKPSNVLKLLLDLGREDPSAARVYVREARALMQLAAALDGSSTDPELVGLRMLERLNLDIAPSAGPEPDAPSRELDDLLAELDALIGLRSVKEAVHDLVNVSIVERLRRQHGLPVPDRTHHRVFVGNPGTGKTTVARLLARIFAALDVFAEGQLVEVQRADLVGEFVGKTAPKTEAAVRTALGGVLFIDEAYSLVGTAPDYGGEAITTLVKMMEDHRDEFMLVAAGYPDEMAAFVDANPGLASRLNETISFPDYSPVELVAILEKICADNGYILELDRADMSRLFEGPHVEISNGNARLARSAFEEATVAQARRIVGATPDREMLMQLTVQDFGLGGVV